jgi:hypothetical protein
MSMYLMKQINVMSVSKIGAMLGLVFGLIHGIMLAIAIGAIGPFLRLLHPVLAGLGAGLVFLMAIIMGLVAGFIGGAIVAFVYNCAASHIGPIEVDLEVKA